jgi:HSP20 family protein
MTVTGTKDMVKREKSRYISPFEEMERWLENTWTGPFSLLGSSFWPEMKLAEYGTISPSVDIYDEGNELVLKADLPGLKKKDLDINLTENMLTITGEKKKEEKVEREDYYRYERSHGSFCRRFEIPHGIDTGKIKAHFKDGLLEVRLPKTDEAKVKSKKISLT